MDGAVWKKRLRAALRTGWTLALLLSSVVLWRFGLSFAEQIGHSGQIVQYQGDESLFGASYAAMHRREGRAQQPREFTLWNQRNGQMLQDPLTGRQAEAPVLLFAGDAGLLLPGLWPLGAQDERGCVLGAGTAIRLFGDPNAQNAQVILGEKSYVVRAVVDRPYDLMLVRAAEDDPLPHVRMRGKADAEAFAMRHGLVQAPVQVSYFENLSGLFSHAPVLCSLGIALFWLHRLKKSQAAYPLRYTLLLIAFFGLLTASALYALRLVPSDYLPSRWSDFEHFAALGRQLKTQTLAFFTMEKSLPDVQISRLFFGSCAGLLSAALLLIAHRRLWPLAKARSPWHGPLSPINEGAPALRD